MSCRVVVCRDDCSENYVLFAVDNEGLVLPVPKYGPAPADIVIRRGFRAAMLEARGLDLYITPRRRSEVAVDPCPWSDSILVHCPEGGSAEPDRWITLIASNVAGEFDEGCQKMREAYGPQDCPEFPAGHVTPTFYTQSCTAVEFCSAVTERQTIAAQATEVLRKHAAANAERYAEMRDRRASARRRKRAREALRRHNAAV